MLPLASDNRSYFSPGDSLLSPGDIVNLAIEGGYSHVAIADTMTVNGMVDFSRAAKGKIEPIVGVTLTVYEDPAKEMPPKGAKLGLMWQCQMYARNEQGMNDILAILNLANSKPFLHVAMRGRLVPRVGVNHVAKVLARGHVSVVLSVEESVSRSPHVADIVGQLKSVAQDDSALFVELTAVQNMLYERVNALHQRLATDFDLPVVASLPWRYATEEAADSLDVMRVVIQGSMMDSPWNHFRYQKDFTPLTWNEFEEELACVGVNVSAVEAGMNKLVNACQYRWEKLPISLPQIAKDESAELERLIEEGVQRRLMSPVLGYQPTEEQIREEYLPRIQYELSVLRELNFERYFLVVRDFVQWSRDNGVLTGPGRGSIGGSLVAFLIGLTDTDPLRFGLIFERFINPERADYPDADLDFMSSRRHEVIQYLADRYGANRVAGISNYVTLGAASSLRDVGRVSGLQPMQMTATKLVPKEHGVSADLKAAMETVPELAEFAEQNPDVYRHALNIAGCLRSKGQHAAGIVVAAEPIKRRAVVEQRSEFPVVNWDKQSVEDFGMIKFDALGLNTLDMLAKAKTLVMEQHGVDLDLLSIPLDDDAALELMGEGKTTGVFQFESGSGKSLLKDLAMCGKLEFEDIVNATALNRPGPRDSGLLDDYVSIKQGLKLPTYPHPLTEEALKDSCGIMVMQESVMRVSQDLCGFTMAEADSLRKIIGKKLLDKMAAMRDKFVDGACAGQIEATTDSGDKIVCHRLRKVLCDDGERYTLEEAMAQGLEIVEAL